MHILTSSMDDVPLVAICTDCDHDPISVWVRPESDPAARSLQQWMLAHRRAKMPHVKEISWDPMSLLLP